MSIQPIAIDNLLIRCSSIGKIMGDPQSAADKAAGNLSSTAKTHCTEIYAREFYGREKDVHTKYFEKGNMVEEKGITLLTQHTGRMYMKNELRLKNEFIAGTPDLFEGPQISQAELVIDIKNAWDLFTFLKVCAEGFTKDYYWQLQGYMALTNAKKAKLVYCLIDTPEILINDECRKLFYKLGAIDDTLPEYQEGCEEIQKSLTYPDIPVHRRIKIWEVERNDEDILKIYDKVSKCRKFIKELHESFEVKEVAK